VKLAIAFFFILCAALSFAGGAASRGQQQMVPSKNAAAPVAADKPKVMEIKEPGLKTLLEASGEKRRPLLVNFWATWCTPCREEFPDLVKIREQFADSQLDFVTISLDEPSEIATTVPEFLAEMRAGRMPAYLLNATDADAAVLIVDKDWRGELPATFLFDPQRKVAFKHTGRVKPSELSAAIEKTLTSN
jgi:thiol-disulfide isomerase/thioredoxin